MQMKSSEQRSAYQIKIKQRRINNLEVVHQNEFVSGRDRLQPVTDKTKYFLSQPWRLAWGV